MQKTMIPCGVFLLRPFKKPDIMLSPVMTESARYGR
jgi:hypothetical protein